MHNTLHPLPKILLLGPIIIDEKSSGGEGEKLFNILSNEGYTVYKRSRYRNKIKRLFSTLWFLLSSAKKYDIAILLVFSGYGAYVYNLMCAIICYITGKPIIAIIHGGAYYQFYKKSKKINAVLFNYFTKIGTPSLFLKNKFDEEKIALEYIPNFIETEYFTYTKRSNFNYKLIWVRAFHQIYNPTMAIRAIKELSNRYPAVLLTMVGSDRGEMAKCKELAKQLNIEHHIVFEGFVSAKKHLNALFHQHDIYINTTQYESFGIANFEAALTGLPIVSTNAGEMPYLWQSNINIRLVDVNDHVCMSEQIADLFESHEQRIKLGEAGYKLANSFSWQQVYPFWLNLFKKVE